MVTFRPGQKLKERVEAYSGSSERCLTPAATANSPPIPAKRYFTIGEVSELCDVKPHVLRYWETEFPSLKPVKRRGNRRYYQRHDVLMVRQIRSLLYEQGYTIGGARLRLDGEGAKQESVDEHPDRPPGADGAGRSASTAEALIAGRKPGLSAARRVQYSIYPGYSAAW